ncbi:murein transglycosylase [Loktanella sp. 1ANDIMAR09]|nr:murein transglycosylase [Loktanella sp. 1ANDIMAR09]
MAEPRYTTLTFDQLKGWRDDNHQAAFDVFKTTCGDMDSLAWATLHEIARTDPAPRVFFEEFFRPVLIEDGNPTLFTGYYEPELTGSRERGEPYRYPIYTRPDDLNHARREIDQDGILANRGLELAWLTDPVDVFFLQVQGSGRIRLPDGSMMRVGFSGKNGRPYTSIGKLLVARGVFGPDQVSADAIRDWVHANGEAGRALLLENESYVFFREVSEIPADHGPLGTMNRSITAGRSIAIDPAFVPLGAPVWIEKDGDLPMHRLMIAQDTGGAIKGAQRADIFFGTGPDAGLQAGRIKDGGRMVVLLPAQLVES